MKARQSCLQLKCAAATACAVLLWASGVHGGAVIHDGTLGPSGAAMRSGNDFAIPSTMGRQVGSNLFHSFSQFNLDPGETANFTGPSGIQNVLARVTGGQSSTINGTIRCTIPDANFYFVNPAGVVFGASAALDVKGSFAVTTADVVKLADGGSFNARTPSDSVLTTAAPAAFGFLPNNLVNPDGSSKPSGVLVIGALTPQNQLIAAELAVPSGKVISIVAGQIQLIGAGLNAPGGRINLASAGGPGDVVLDSASVVSAVDASGLSSMADISLISADLNTAAPVAGSVFVRGNSLSLGLQSTILSATDSGKGGSLDIRLTGGLTVAGASQIAASTTGAGNAGDVNITAGQVTIQGDDPDNFTSISSLTFPGSTGHGGSIHIQTGPLEVTGKAQLSTATFASGDSGPISVTADSIHVSDVGAQIVSLTSPAATGSGGDLTLHASSILLENGGQVFSRNVGSGPRGGIIDLTADSIHVTGSGSSIFGDSGGTTGTGVRIRTGALLLDDSGDIDTEAFAGAAGGGPVNIVAGTIQLHSGGGIKSTTSGDGAAGAIHVAASTLEINGIQSTIAASTLSNGPGGTITLEAQKLSLTDQATISSFTAGGGGPQQGRGGDVNISAGDLLVSGQGVITAGSAASGDAGAVRINADRVLLSGAGSGIKSPTLVRAENLTSGRGGDVGIKARELVVEDGAVISVSTIARDAQGGVDPIADVNGITGPAGNIIISANQMVLRGGTLDKPSSVLSESTVHTPGTGGAGDITLAAHHLRVEDNALVSARTLGPGVGGNVEIAAARTRIARAAQISATSDGIGNAGSVRIDSRRFSILSGTVQVAAQQATGGNITLNARDSVLVRLGLLTAQSGGAGGNIAINAGNEISILGSTVTAQAGGDGGQISIDPPALTLRNSTINALSGGRPVQVKIATGGFLADNSQILTNRSIDFPETDIAGALLPLPTALPGSEIQLAPACGLQLGGNISSFIITGRGGEPPVPGGFLAD